MAAGIKEQISNEEVMIVLPARIERGGRQCQKMAPAKSKDKEKK
jgi:hypothetical protein